MSLFQRLTGLFKRAGAVKTPIDPGLVTMAAQGQTRFFDEKSGQWFGPMVPMEPQAPPDVRGRAFDYPTGINLVTKPRAGEPIDFTTLRTVAENHDVTRLCIETRKDQFDKLKFDIRLREDDKKKDDARIKEVKEFLRFPDRRHTWQQWKRQVLNDLFVIDAPTVYIRQALNNKPFSLDIVDGATIKPLVDGDGRPPLPPVPCYQQYLKGVPAGQFTSDELIYMPRNPRPHKIYGYSPVEQILMVINISMHRQLFQSNFYQAGNVPEGFAETPADWNPDQIAKFQAVWDSMLAGNLEMRRKMLFIPAGTKPYFPKLEGLKDDFDEWLARVVCYCFSLPPTPFVKQMNRAVAATAQEAALQEGLHPLMLWFKDFMDMIIWKGWGYENVEFVWEMEKEIDPDIESQINTRNMMAGLVRRSEIRENLGLDDDGVPDFFMSTGGPVLFDDIGKEPEPEPAPVIVAPPGPVPPGNEPPKEPIPPEKGKEEKPVEPTVKKAFLAKVINAAYKEGLL